MRGLIYTFWKYALASSSTSSEAGGPLDARRSAPPPPAPEVLMSRPRLMEEEAPVAVDGLVQGVCEGA